MTEPYLSSRPPIRLQTPIVVNPALSPAAETSARRVRPVFWVALLIFLAVCMEAGAYLIEWASPRLLQEPIRRRASILREQSERISLMVDSTHQRREALDSVLGWRYRSGFASETDHITAQGLRGFRVYDSLPGPRTLRVAAFGDSFTYGNEVADGDTWTVALEKTNKDLEALNYGVGGYGVDQAFLRYELEGSSLHPDVVLMGFMSDDLRRMVNVYRRFISSLELPLTKPRFVLRPDRTLSVAANPLPSRGAYQRLLQNPEAVRELGALDHWYSATVYENPLYDYVASLRVAHALFQRLDRRFASDRLFRGDDEFNEHSSAFALQVAVMRAFADSVRARRAIPAVLFLVDRNSVEKMRRGKDVTYATLRDALVGEGITVWDAADAFRATTGPLDPLFASGGHYSGEGNRLVARWLAVHLDSLRGRALAARR